MAEIVYTDSVDGITPERLPGFFVGWPHSPSPETHLRILRQSTMIELAIDSESGRVVGFVNAVSDNVMAAYIPLLEVLPEYQHRGIATVLVRRLLKRLDPLYMIDLACDENMVPFYERFEFKPMRSMVRRNFDRQSCD